MKIPKILNIKKFNKYNNIEKKMFEAYRSAMLLMMPTLEDSEDYEDQAIEYAEKFAETIVDGWPVLYDVEPTVTKETGAAGVKVTNTTSIAKNVSTTANDSVKIVITLKK